MDSEACPGHQGRARRRGIADRTVTPSRPRAGPGLEGHSNFAEEAEAFAAFINLMLKGWAGG